MLPEPFEVFPRLSRSEVSAKVTLRFMVGQSVSQSISLWCRAPSFVCVEFYSLLFLKQHLLRQCESVMSYHPDLLHLFTHLHIS